MLPCLAVVVIHNKMTIFNQKKIFLYQSINECILNETNALKKTQKSISTAQKKEAICKLKLEAVKEPLGPQFQHLSILFENNVVWF